MVRIGTDWFVKVKCPRPDKAATNREQHIQACSGCPYAIWDAPEPVAGFMASMCGVRVGSIGMAADLDDIGERLIGVERFTKTDGHTGFKIRLLKNIRLHAENTGWRITSCDRRETLAHLDRLVEFCTKAEAKGLEIAVWA